MDAHETDALGTDDDLVIRPAPGDLSLLQGLAERLRWATDVTLKCDGEEPTELPESLVEGIRRLAGYLASDASVEIKPYEEIVTTQQAASLLGISRPHLIHLIEKERVMPYQPGERPGRHRRMRLRDVLAYREQRSRRAVESVSGEFDSAVRRATNQVVAQG